jgi:hypothetical protein
LSLSSFSSNPALQALLNSSLSSVTLLDNLILSKDIFGPNSLQTNQAQIIDLLYFGIN